MLLKRFEVIEHTADIALRVFAESRAKLFINAARGMFFLIAQKKSNAGKQKPAISFEINLSADTTEELLVNWLSELLTLSDIHDLFFYRFQISKLSRSRLSAKAYAEKRAKSSYTTKTEIKAVTYHRLNIKRKKGHWEGKIIFDI